MSKASPGQKIDNAPGFEWRGANKETPIWTCPRKIVKAGYTPSTVRLNPEMTPDQLAAACRTHLASAQDWVTKGNIDIRIRSGDAGTVKALIRAYENSPISRFNAKGVDGQPAIKFNTKNQYADWNVQIWRMVGDRILTNVTAQDLWNWYIGFQTPKFEGDPPMLPKAKACMEQFGRLLQFGIMAEMDGCLRLATIINGVRTAKGSRKAMTFAGGARRDEELTLDHVIAFCAVANQREQSSMALATVLQFESLARQADIIGQWWPISNATEGPLVQKTRNSDFIQWRGLTWGVHIGTDLVMIKPTSKSNGRKKAIADLSISPLVMAELERVPMERRIGPVIISEYTGLPYRRKNFNQLWRKIAKLAGIPDEVQDRDARAGGITEAHTAEAPAEHIRSSATHSNRDGEGGKAINESYDRQNIAKARSVQLARYAKRTA